MNSSCAPHPERGVRKKVCWLLADALQQEKKLSLQEAFSPGAIAGTSRWQFDVPVSKIRIRTAHNRVYNKHWQRMMGKGQGRDWAT